MKAFLFDADGVVLKKHEELFSVRFAREHGAPLEEVSAFFKNRFRLCQEGKTDLKKELEPLLPTWGWKEGVDAFLDYWFEGDVELNKEVMKAVYEFKKKGVKCYLATDQERYRAEYIQNLLGKEFDGLFFSYKLGRRKSDPRFFEEVLKELELPASEVSYRDDDEKDVEVAKGVGIDARFYKTIADLEVEKSESKIPRV